MNTIFELLAPFFSGVVGAASVAAVLRAWLTRPVLAKDEPSVDAPEALDYHTERTQYHRQKRGEAMRRARGETV